MNDTPILGETLTEEDEFYIAWARETVKRNLDFANEILRRLVTLASSLLGGGLVFYDKLYLSPTLRLLVLLFFLGSLIASFVGMMPYEAAPDQRVPAEIKTHKKAALAYKRRLLWISGFMLTVGFGSAIGPLVVQFFTGVPAK